MSSSMSVDPTAYSNPPMSPRGAAPTFPQYAATPRPGTALEMLVTPEQRERGESFLQEAYADGRLTHADFEVRLDQVLGATTRRELNQAFYGLVSVPTASQALGLHPAYRPLVSPRTTERTGKAAAALAHFSVFLTWFFGPLLMFMLASKGSYAKRQAAQAFNFQIYTILGGAAVGAADSLLGGHLGWMFGIGFVGWFVLTLVGGVKASQGDNWTNPVNRVIPWKPLDEK